MIPCFLRRLTALIIAFFCLLATPVFSGDLDTLSQRLISDGFDKTAIEALFSKKEVFFNPSGVSLFFIHSESSLNYDQFISDESIAKAAAYMETHNTDLENAQQKYGVDKTIITAIILVETRLGTYLGKRSVFNTLATMAALTEDPLIEKIWEAIPEDKKPTREDFLKKVKRRTQWGYNELKALLKYATRENLDPVELNGSYAGAMGISQFMPSNALTLARDGNQDGSVNLFHHADAIHSIANYLKHYGWKPDIPQQKKHEILFKYNHSNYYVDALLKISDRLKG